MVDVPQNTTTTAVLEKTSDSLTGTYSGRLETAGDIDWIRVSLTAGQAYDFFLSFQAVGSAFGDSVLTLRDSTGAAVATNDDAVPGPGVAGNSFLSFTPAASGTFYIEARAFNFVRGSYSLLMTGLEGTEVFLNTGDNTSTANPGERIVGEAGNDTINLGTVGFDALGEQGDDILTGNAEGNLLSGGLGNDFVSGGNDSIGSGDSIFGDAGDDLLFGGNGEDQVFGGAGDDVLNGDAGSDTLAGGTDNDTLDGGDNNDRLTGGDGNDKLDGSGGRDVLAGGDGSDRLNGGGSNDRLVGGGGRDVLTGGSGADTFVYTAIADSRVALTGRDIIRDFAGTDTIDLAAIDAIAGGGNNAFTFRAGEGAAFTGLGQVRFFHQGGNTFIDLNTAGSNAPDMRIEITGIVNLNAGDFIL